MINFGLVLQQSFEMLNSRLVLALNKKGNNTSASFRFESGKFPVTRKIKAYFSRVFFFTCVFYLILGVAKVDGVVIILLSF